MADPEKLLTVTVVTPNGIVYSHKSTIVVLDAIDGERGIMYDHAPLLTPLGIGEVRVKRDHASEDKTDYIAVNGGYVEFSNNIATIIADSAEGARNIDIKRAQSAKERAEQHLADAKKKHDERSYLKAQIALRRAVNRIHVYSDLSK